MKTPLVDQNGNHFPWPEGEAKCDDCPNRKFKDWNDLGIHITLVHNDNGRRYNFWKNGKPPQEVLNHPDWSGFEDD